MTEQGGMAAGYEVSAMLAKTVRNMDSTRLVSGALCSFFKGLEMRTMQLFGRLSAKRCRKVVLS